MNRTRISRFLVLLAAGFSIYLTIRLWIWTTSYQEIWPLPGLYLLEMAWLPVVGIALTMLGSRGAVYGLWAISGAILGFIIMGALSIGPAYFPVFVLMLVSAILSPNRWPRDYLLGLGISLLAGVAQVGYILAAFRVLGS